MARNQSETTPTLKRKADRDDKMVVIIKCEGCGNTDMDNMQWWVVRKAWHRVSRPASDVLVNPEVGDSDLEAWGLECDDCDSDIEIPDSVEVIW